MNESLTEPLHGDGIPPWMTSVSEETLYNAQSDPSTDESSRDEFNPEPSANLSESDTPEKETSSPDSSSEPSSSLSRRLALTMAEPSEIPEPAPNLQPTVVGRVRADLHEELEKAVSVLKTRYATALPKSLVLEFVLHRMLRALREDGTQSPLVRWLDSALPRQ